MGVTDSGMTRSSWPWHGELEIVQEEGKTGLREARGEHWVVVQRKNKFWPKVGGVGWLRGAVRHIWDVGSVRPWD